MKRINIITALFAGLVAFTACESDRDDNPTFVQPADGTFVLNTPALAGSIYDLEYSETLELSCSQPAYGFTAPTIYSVEVSLDETFTNSEELATVYNTALMNVDASEFAVATTNLAVANGKTEADFPYVGNVFVRLNAKVADGLGEITSNVVELPQVKFYFALPPVNIPTELYLVGGFCEWNWDNSPAMVPCYDGTTGTFWRMVYFPANCGWKFNIKTSWDGNECGYDKCAELVDNASAGVTRSDDGNIVVTNEGWYLIVIRSSVSGRDINYVVEVNKPEVWLIGNVTPKADWSELEEGMMFEVPTSADGYFVSPAFANGHAEGSRAYVKVQGFDWWKTEFMVFDGKLEYRGAGGDQDRVPVTAGQKLYINFMSDTGKIE
jgi:hypothetical protein